MPETLSSLYAAAQEALDGLEQSAALHAVRNKKYNSAKLALTNALNQRVIDRNTDGTAEENEKIAENLSKTIDAIDAERRILRTTWAAKDGSQATPDPEADDDREKCNGFCGIGAKECEGF
jgi:hypothetical protein